MAANSTQPADRLRSDLSDLTELAGRDLSAVWRDLDTPEAARQALNDLLPNLVAVYGAAASTLAANWYDDLRDEKGIKGRFGAIVADLPADPGTEALAGFAVGSLYQAKPDWDAGLTLAQGGLQRRIANMSRQTVMGSSVSDPEARGWERQTAGGCAFCEMIAGRGQVFSEASADFASHDACRCVAIPSFDGSPKPVRSYTPSSRNITDADRARVRAYLRTH